jgi:hypothetical protein
MFEGRYFLSNSEKNNKITYLKPMDLALDDLSDLSDIQYFVIFSYTFIFLFSDMSYVSVVSAYELIGPQRME